MSSDQANSEQAWIDFSGASDDLICCGWSKGVTPRDENETHELEETDSQRWRGWIVTHPDGKRFYVLHHFDGSWSFRVAPVNTDDSMEEFERMPWVGCRFSNFGRDYSAELRVLVPHGTTIGFVE